jgi:hypothetical protein
MIYCYSEPISPADDHRSPEYSGQVHERTPGFRVVHESLSMPDRDTFASRRVMSRALSTMLGKLAARFTGRVGS